MMGQEVGQGKMKYFNISCCMVLSQPGHIQHQSLAVSLDLSYPIHAVLVIITGWHNQSHFTLLPPMQQHRPPPLPMPTTILLGTGAVVLGLGMQ